MSQESERARKLAEKYSSLFGAAVPVPLFPGAEAFSRPTTAAAITRSLSSLPPMAEPDQARPVTAWAPATLPKNPNRPRKKKGRVTKGRKRHEARVASAGSTSSADDGGRPARRGSAPVSRRRKAMARAVVEVETSKRGGRRNDGDDYMPRDTSCEMVGSRMVGKDPLDEVEPATAGDAAENDPFDEVEPATAGDAAENDPFDEVEPATAGDAAENDPFDEVEPATAGDAAENDPFDEVEPATAGDAAENDPFDEVEPATAGDASENDPFNNAEPTPNQPTPPPLPPVIIRVARARPEVIAGIRAAAISLGPGYTVLDDDGPLETAGWDILWTWKTNAMVDWPKLAETQKTNHLPEIRRFTGKGLMAVRLRRFLEGLKPAQCSMFTISPEAFVLPAEYTQFTRRQLELDGDGNEGGLGGRWIIKPTGKSRGRGITLAVSIDDVVYTEECVIQRYLPRPLMYKGVKVDVRCYMLILQAPLRCWLHKGMYARLAALPYSDAHSAARDLGVHLTNTSLAAPGTDTKMDLNTVLDAEAELRGDPALPSTVRAAVRRVVSRLLTVFQTELGTIGQSGGRCFELVGLDLLIDQDLRPWVIEANASPSVAVAAPSDYEIKVPMLGDVLRAVAGRGELGDGWVQIQPVRRRG